MNEIKNKIIFWLLERTIPNQLVISALFSKMSKDDAFAVLFSKMTRGEALSQLSNYYCQFAYKLPTTNVMVVFEETNKNRKEVLK